MDAFLLGEVPKCQKLLQRDGATSVRVHALEDGEHVLRGGFGRVAAEEADDLGEVERVGPVDVHAAEDGLGVGAAQLVHDLQHGGAFLGLLPPAATHQRL